MKEIKLTQGKVALIDDADFEKISSFKWKARLVRTLWYATAHVGNWRERKFIHMHNLLMNPPIGFIVDHRDHNGLNCQRSNMRLCTHAQNSKNRSAYGASKYLGVAIRRNRDCTYWIAAIQSNKKRMHLGFFKSEKEAALAYNNAAKEHHGEFSNLNNLE